MHGPLAFLRQPPDRFLRVNPPRLALRLGLSGLLPQVAAAWVLLDGNPDWHFTALAMSYFYAAVILSFLGGLWWGLAAKADRTPPWIWFAAVIPSLIAFGSAWPWAVGYPWPGPSMIALGLSLIVALAMDWHLHRTGIAPAWWMGLRVPLSIGLGGITLMIGVLVPH